MKGWLISKPEGDKFTPPADGWVQILSLGDWPNEQAGIVQVCDSAALDAIKADFDQQAKADNWPGMLVDYDHFSHDKDKPSGAAGWADAVERRGDELWAHIRFSETGERQVRGGEYRLVSPVLTEFEEVDGSRKRPKKLYRLALTNDPNIKGLAPVSNRATATTTTQEKAKNMEHTAMVKELLGLEAAATDDQVTEAYNRLKEDVLAENRKAAEEAERAKKKKDEKEDEDEDEEETAKNRSQIEALLSRVSELETELVERDAAQFDGLLEDKPEAKKALRELASYNRASFRTVMSAVRQPKQEDPKPAPKVPSLPPLFNRRVQPLPGAARSGEAGGPGGDNDEIAATKTRLHAQKLLALNRTRGMTWNQAFDIAKREVRAGVADIELPKTKGVNGSDGE